MTLPVALALGVLGCSSSSQSAGGADAGTDSDIIGCTGDTQAQTYSRNMAQMGKSNVFRFILVDANPAPTGKGSEVWTLKVVDAAGSPVTDATFPVMKPWMPLHQHGCSCTVQITNNHDGTYTLSPMYFYMSGLWQTEITAQSGTRTDSTSFFFCLQ
jgi:hypothetical protein